LHEQIIKKGGRYDTINKQIEKLQNNRRFSNTYDHILHHIDLFFYTGDLPDQDILTNKKLNQMEQLINTFKNFKKADTAEIRKTMLWINWTLALICFTFFCLDI